MIIMWFSAWLYNFLGTTHDSWWALPYVMTSTIFVIFEFLTYGFFIDQWVRKQT